MASSWPWRSCGVVGGGGGGAGGGGSGWVVAGGRGCGGAAGCAWAGSERASGGHHPTTLPGPLFFLPGTSALQAATREGGRRAAVVRGSSVGSRAPHQQKLDEACQEQHRPASAVGAPAALRPDRPANRPTPQPPLPADRPHLAAHLGHDGLAGCHQGGWQAGAVGQQGQQRGQQGPRQQQLDGAALNVCGCVACAGTTAQGGSEVETEERQRWVRGCARRGGGGGQGGGQGEEGGKRGGGKSEGGKAHLARRPRPPGT
jgi:hypothetical protein